ncbi:MAG: beta-ketoacyl synthase N-terminal-like domain-containing protein [Acidobacteriota bacterium]|nr:beta-ketoacyl synthase N-terminal-like domain-containing protein [Acidobacteriota bacterium]
MSLSSVVISGLGAASAAGLGREAQAQALAGAAPVPQEVDRSAGYHRPEGARKALLVRDVAGLARWVPPMEARRLSRPSKLTVAAVRMALEDAELTADELAGPTAVVVATTFGPSEFTERILQQILADGPQGASPFLFTQSVANAPAAQVAMALSARGPNITVTQRSAGALIALGRAVEAVASGRVQRAVVAAVEEVSPLLHAVLDRFGALAGSSGGKGQAAPGADEVARPFDRRRDGFLLAEGATALILESEDAVAARGGSFLARCRLAVGAFDVDAPRSGWGEDPSVLLHRLRDRLAAAGLTTAHFDRVVAGASGTPAGDRLEGLLLRRLFDDAPPPVLAPKGALGEYGGGLLAPAVLAASGVPFGPTVGFQQEDPEIGLSPGAGEVLEPPRRVLASELAAGGAAAWVVLEAPDA